MSSGKTTSKRSQSRNMQQTSRLQPNSLKFSLRNSWPAVPYHVLLRSLLNRNHIVSSVSLRSIAHHADWSLILLTEEFQGFPMFCTQCLPTSCSFCWLGTQLFGNFCHSCQLPVGPEVCFWGSFSALRAKEDGV